MTRWPMILSALDPAWESQVLKKTWQREEVSDSRLTRGGPVSLKSSAQTAALSSCSARPGVRGIILPSGPGTKYGTLRRRRKEVDCGASTAAPSRLGIALNTHFLIVC